MDLLVVLYGPLEGLPGQYNWHALMKKGPEAVNETAAVNGDNTHTYTPCHLRVRFFPGPDSLLSSTGDTFIRKNLGYLSLVHALWNFQAQSTHPEVILNVFLVLGTCFIFIQPFTSFRPLSLIALCILYYKSYLQQSNWKLGL